MFSMTFLKSFVSSMVAVQIKYLLMPVTFLLEVVYLLINSNVQEHSFLDIYNVETSCIPRPNNQCLGCHLDVHCVIVSFYGAH